VSGQPIPVAHSDRSAPARFRFMRLTPISRASTPGIRLLQFLVVSWLERIQTTSPVWSVRLEWDRPGFRKIGRPLPTTSNGSAKSTESVASDLRYEPTERRFKGADWSAPFLPPQPLPGCRLSHDSQRAAGESGALRVWCRSFGALCAAFLGGAVVQLLYGHSRSPTIPLCVRRVVQNYSKRNSSSRG
jgi:hypothetical protein